MSEFTVKYLEFVHKFRENTFDDHLYNWLVMKMDRLQTYLGVIGIMHYIAPYRKYSVPNYHIVVNTVPKFRTSDISAFDINAVHDCLLRLAGEIERDSETLNKEMKNPLIWFRNGVREVLALPFLVLSWLGITPDTFSGQVKRSWIFRALSGVVSLVSLVSGLTTIVMGYDAVIRLLKSILS